MYVYTLIAELMYVVDFQNSVYAMATDAICAMLLNSICTYTESMMIRNIKKPFKKHDYHLHVFNLHNFHFLYFSNIIFSFLYYDKKITGNIIFSRKN